MSLKKLLFPCLALAVLIVVIFGSATFAQSVSGSTLGQIGVVAAWVQAYPTQSCSSVCYRESLSPVSSGRDKFGYSFYVCRGLATNSELRPGFNIATSSESQNLCLYEFGGTRGLSSNYDCLCLKTDPITNR